MFTASIEQREMESSIILLKIVTGDWEHRFPVIHGDSGVRSFCLQVDSARKLHLRLQHCHEGL